MTVNTVYYGKRAPRRIEEREHIPDLRKKRKEKDRHILSNYRPVSLTCECCKLLENIICHHVRDHLDKYKMLTPLQHGFKMELLITLHYLMSLFVHKLQVDVAVLDISKAFNWCSTTNSWTSWNTTGLTATDISE